jgi:hypothetical protein
MNLLARNKNERQDNFHIQGKGMEKPAGLAGLKEPSAAAARAACGPEFSRIQTNSIYACRVANLIGQSNTHKRGTWQMEYDNT